jgi:hypothetical protein
MFPITQSNATDRALEGFVRDPSAASIPNATVVATNLRTGQVSTETTSTEGDYRFPLLQVGEYELLVTASGFGEYRRAGIRLSAGQQARVDVALIVWAPRRRPQRADGEGQPCAQPDGQARHRDRGAALPRQERPAHHRVGRLCAPEAHAVFRSRGDEAIADA